MKGARYDFVRAAQEEEGEKEGRICAFRRMGEKRARGASKRG